MEHSRATCVHFMKNLLTDIKNALRTIKLIWALKAVVRRCFVKKGVLRNFAKFTGKHLYQILFFNKVAGLNNSLWHRCFPVNFAKFLRTSIFTKYLRTTASVDFFVILHFYPCPYQEPVSFPQ